MTAIIINARQQKIVEILCKTNSQTPITVATLARIVGASERAIRYDLIHVEEELAARGFCLRRKSQKGLWVEPMYEHTTPRVAVKEYIMSRDERCWAVIAMVLSCREPVSSDDIAARLAVSRSTLLTDLKTVRQMLGEYKLTLKGRRGAGISIVGEETSVRKLLLQIFSQYHYDFAVVAAAAQVQRYEYDLLRFYVGDMPIDRIYIIFRDFAAKRCAMLSDFSLTCMMLSLLIQLKRAQLGFHLSAEAVQQFQIEDNHQLYVNAKYLFEQLTAARLIEFDETELLFCMMQLLSSKLTLVERPADDEQAAGTARLMEGFSLARSFIEYCQVWLNEILVDDDELLYNLALHLQPAIKRAHYGIELTNPLLPKIRQEYGNLFLISLRAAEKIEQRLNVKISDDEIGYLTIHLGAALERRKSMFNRKLNVVLVCGNGIGTSNLLARTLLNRVEYLNIVKITAARELDKAFLDVCDIIISTLPLDLKNEAVLYISPILSEDEITVIEQQLQYFYRRKFPAKGSREQEMACAISLGDLLNEAILAIDAVAENWEEAISLSGDLLVKSGSVTSGYVEAMIRCVREMGPYIVISNGLAMPHALCEDGVSRVGLSVVRLKEPVYFGNSQHDPVDLIFAFASVDEKAHLHLLEELWNLFNDAAALDDLRHCADKQAMLAILRRFAQKKSIEKR